MKDIRIYYFAILAPIPFLYYASSLGSGWFVFSMLFYLLVYRTLTDTLRLSSKKVFRKKHFWKMLIPGSRGRYFKILYLEK